MPEALLRAPVCRPGNTGCQRGDIVAVDIAPDVATIVAQSAHITPSTSAGEFRHDYRYLKRRRQNAFYPAVIKSAPGRCAGSPTLPPGKYTVDGDNLFFTVVGVRRVRWEQRGISSSVY